MLRERDNGPLNFHSISSIFRAKNRQIRFLFSTAKQSTSERGWLVVR